MLTFVCYCYDALRLQLAQSLCRFDVAKPAHVNVDHGKNEVTNIIHQSCPSPVQSHSIHLEPSFTIPGSPIVAAGGGSATSSRLLSLGPLTPS